MNIALVNPAVTETLLHETRGISPRSTPQTVLSTTKEKSMPSTRESISLVACVEEDRVRLAYSHCVVRQTDLLVRDGNLVGLASGFVLGRHVPDPVRVDVESGFNLRHATWRWRDPIEMELPKQIIVLGHRMLSFEDLDENTRLAVIVRRGRQSLLRGKGGVAFDELRRGITCCLQTH